MNDSTVPPETMKEVRIEPPDAAAGLLEVVDRLTTISTDPTQRGTTAATVAELVAEGLELLAVGLGELERRQALLELAGSELARRTENFQPAGGGSTTVFGIPVVLAEGVDDVRVRDEIAKLPTVGAAEAIELLEGRGILRKTGR